MGLDVESSGAGWASLGCGYLLKVGAGLDWPIIEHVSYEVKGVVSLLYVNGIRGLVSRGVSGGQGDRPVAPGGIGAGRRETLLMGRLGKPGATPRSYFESLPPRRICDSTSGPGDRGLRSPPWGTRGRL